MQNLWFSRTHSEIIAVAIRLAMGSGIFTCVFLGGHHSANGAAGDTGPASPILNLAVNTMLTLTSDEASYHNDEWTYIVKNNPWNKGRLVNGVDYKNAITFDPTTFPNGIDFSWSWPLAWPFAGWHVMAYPEIKFIPHNAYGAAISTQVANFINLTSKYSVAISGNTGGFNVSYDLWLTDKPNGTILDEIMIWVHSPSVTTMEGNQPFRITNSSISNASLGVWPARDATGWKFIGIKTQADVLMNTLSLSDILKTLIWNGIITGREYLSDVQFGAEVQQGTGGFHINNFSNIWNANASLVGGHDNDRLVIGTPGGNHVIGNGNNDTVVYSDLYSNFQIKEVGSETLIIKGGDISTLDVLQGVQYIEFSDGIYNVTNSMFTRTQVRFPRNEKD